MEPTAGYYFVTDHSSSISAVADWQCLSRGEAMPIQTAAGQSLAA